MIYSLLADLVLVIHMAFVMFVVFGGLLAYRWPRLIRLHLPAVAWGVAIEFFGFICPLTPLEVSLRKRGGEAGYEGGFIDHYITATLYPSGLTRTHQFALGAFVFVLNAAIYFYGYKRRRRNPLE